VLCDLGKRTVASEMVFRNRPYLGKGPVLSVRDQQFREPGCPIELSDVPGTPPAVARARPVVDDGIWHSGSADVALRSSRLAGQAGRDGAGRRNRTKAL